VRSVACRVQRLRDKVSPEFLKQVVEYYFCGYLRFSASLIWHRSSVKHRKEVRFHYCMAMAACLGLSTLEALNLSCCKNQSVTEENSYYHKLLLETGLPSMYEMACHDSVSVTNQLYGIAPEWYRTMRHIRLAKKGFGKLGEIRGVRDDCKNTLIDSLYASAKAYFSKFYNGREAVRKQKEALKIECENSLLVGYTATDGTFVANEIFPAVRRLRRRECAEKCKSIGTPYLERYFKIKEMCTVNSKINYRHCFSTFMLSSRHIFDCLDTLDRISHFKTPIRKRVEEQSQSADLQGTPCRQNNKRKINKTDFQVDLKMDVWDEDVPSCKFCDLTFEKSTAKKGKFKSHLLYECGGVHNSQPIKRANLRGKPKALYKRLAELAAPFDPGGQQAQPD